MENEVLQNSFRIFVIFLKLGLTSFGGPVAHLGYFHKEFVAKRRWFDEAAFADLVALCQMLPGPASSQVGLAIGRARGGLSGAVAAWLGFTLPSAVLMTVIALGINILRGTLQSGALHGLKIVAVAVVAQAIWSLGVRLCPDRPRATVAALAVALVSLLPFASGQILVIGLGALVGVFLMQDVEEAAPTTLQAKVQTKAAFVSLALFVPLLFTLPLLAARTDLHAIRLADSFFRSGALVFGGGHVVLPLLNAEVVDTGWVSPDAFMAGYGAAQAMPGPLFSFAAFLGASSNRNPSGVAGAVVALIAMFLPSFFLVFGTLPFWEKFRDVKALRRGLVGINAAVVGLLIAAFYNPVWTSAIHSQLDFAFALVCFLLLAFWAIPAWAVVLIGAIVGGICF